MFQLDQLHFLLNLVDYEYDPLMFGNVWLFEFIVDWEYIALFKIPLNERIFPYVFDKLPLLVCFVFRGIQLISYGRRMYVNVLFVLADQTWGELTLIEGSLFEDILVDLSPQDFSLELVIIFREPALLFRFARWTTVLLIVVIGFWSFKDHFFNAWLFFHLGLFSIVIIFHSI